MTTGFTIGAYIDGIVEYSILKLSLEEQFSNKYLVIWDIV
jgi:hypothetical protein